MASRRNRWAARAVLGTLLALGAHLAVYAVVELFDLFPPLPKLAPSTASPSSASAQPTKPEDDRPMEIETIVNQLDRPEEKSAEEKLREEQEKKEQDDKNPHGQVVDIARPMIEERPDTANFVSEYDSKVDKQTRGATGRDQAGGKPAVAPPLGDPSAREPMPGEAARQKAEAKPGRPGPLAMRELEKRRANEGGHGPQATVDGDFEKAGSRQNPEQARREQPAGENGNDGQKNASASPGRPEQMPGLPGGKPNLSATPDMLERAIGKGSGSMDYLKDVDDGESTALNSKKWKHAPFFNRIKRSVANEWHPEVVYVRHDPSGNVYGVKDRVTVLRIHLNPDGKLGAWTVLQSSGVDFLDDEAIDAFRKAGPFPNPPKELVEPDGQIHFNFAFIFELSGRGSLKVFKYQ